jgi:hypothetical protein
VLDAKVQSAPRPCQGIICQLAICQRHHQYVSQVIIILFPRFFFTFFFGRGSATHVINWGMKGKKKAEETRGLPKPAAAGAPDEGYHYSLSQAPRMSKK